MFETNGMTECRKIENKRKYLFLRQIEMLDGFLKNGAITCAQYDTSYTGLITKMNVTEEELYEWTADANK